MGPTLPGTWNERPKSSLHVPVYPTCVRVVDLAPPTILAGPVTNSANRVSVSFAVSGHLPIPITKGFASAGISQLSMTPRSRCGDRHGGRVWHVVNRDLDVVAATEFAVGRRQPEPIPPGVLKLAW